MHTKVTFMDREVWAWIVLVVSVGKWRGFKPR